MEELYWITRLDSIHTFFCVLAGLSGMLTAVMFAVSIGEDDDCRKNLFGKMRITALAFLIGICGCIFVPTTKEALIIYGVGSTIDYVKQDSTARQLPHKVIVALDRFLTSTEEEQGK